MKRLITGGIVVATWLLLLFQAPFPLFWLTMTGLSALTLAEYLGMVLPGLDRTRLLVLVLFGMAPVIASGSGQPIALLSGLILAMIALLLYTIVRYSSMTHPFDLISRSGFGYLYIGLCGAHLVLLTTLPAGRYWLLLLTAITTASDTFAYYTGTLIGRHKLCPAISPGKTWEGFLGGLIGGIGAAALVGFYFLPDQSLVMLGLLAIFLSSLSAAGDLSESMVKRAFDIKDAGKILPGHGGLLDRVNSLLLTAPFLFYFLYFLGRLG